MSTKRTAFSGASGSQINDTDDTGGGIGALSQRKDKPGKRVKLVQKNKKGRSSKVRLKKTVASDSDYE